MQSSAIESRTQLRLNVEIEEQKQKLADLKISKEQERAKLGIVKPVLRGHLWDKEKVVF